MNMSNQQRPPQGQFSPGTQPGRPAMMNNRPPMMQPQSNIRPNVMNQQQPIAGPGLSPYRPTGKQSNQNYY